MKKKKRKLEVEELKEAFDPPSMESFVSDPEETEPREKTEEEKTEGIKVWGNVSIPPSKRELRIYAAVCEHDDVEIGLGGHHELTIRGCKKCRRVEIDLYDPWNHDKGKKPNGDEYNVKRVLRGLVISKGK